MKFAWRGETSAPPIMYPFSPQSSSICPAPTFPGGFLNTEPKVRLFVGWVAFRRVISSATSALISSTGRGARRYSTRATTWSGRSREWRYSSPSSSGPSHPLPSADTTNARTRIVLQSEPYAPAFIRTPPPAVPGMAQANSRPPSPASRARCRQTAFAAPPPTRRRWPSISTSARSPASRRTSASTLSSAARRFEPSPTVRIASSRSVAQAIAASSSATDAGRAKAAAGPPVPIVVRRARGTAVSISIELRRPVFGRERLEDRPRRPPRLAHAEGQDEVARSDDGEREPDRVVERRRPHSPGRLGNRVEDEPRRNPFPRRVATPDEVGDDRDIGEAERLAELLVQLSCPLDDVRHVHRNEPSRRTLPRGL